MKTTNIIIAILLNISFSSPIICSAQTPKDLILEASKSIEQQDYMSLQKFVIVDSRRTSEAAQALSELLILTQSGRWETFIKEKRSVLQELDIRPLQRFLIAVPFYFQRLPSFETMAEIGEYIEDENIFLVKIPGAESGMKERIYRIELLETNQQQKFWIPVDNIEDLIISSKVVKAVMALFENDQTPVTQTNIDNITDRFIEPTKLEFEEQMAQGRINGKNWAFNYGIAVKKQTFGKEKISISLSNLKAKEDCPFVLDGNQVFFSIDKIGEYDFTLNGINITLYDKATQKNIVVNDGKVVVTSHENGNILKGKIVGMRGEDNYINGTFTVRLCER